MGGTCIGKADSFNFYYSGELHPIKKDASSFFFFLLIGHGSPDIYEYKYYEQEYGHVA